MSSLEAKISSKFVRRNSQIKVPQVRLIGEDGEQIGVLETHKAMAIAKERELDLVEISPMTSPPVCKIMNWGHFKYEQNLKERKQRKASRVLEEKTIRLSARIEQHDLETKSKNARKFLTKGHKVKIMVVLKGRENAHKEKGVVGVNSFAELVSGVSVKETEPKIERNTVSATLAPRKNN